MNERKPQTAFRFSETKIPHTWRTITRMRKCFDRRFQSISVYYLWYSAVGSYSSEADKELPNFENLTFRFI